MTSQAAISTSVRRIVSIAWLRHFLAPYASMAPGRLQIADCDERIEQPSTADCRLWTGAMTDERNWAISTLPTKSAGGIQLTNLPAQPAPLIARAQGIAAVCALLRRP